MQSQNKLFLIDAYALIYRAYFAFINNPRINSKGVDTSAVFGFTNSLFEIIKKEKPTHLAVVFDTKAPTQRHVDFPQYKAQREAMPEGIREALPYIDLLLEALNIPKIFLDGFEADDLIGTLAKKAEAKGFVVYMMTPDKDFAQLVSENIFMYRPATKWSAATKWGVKEVLDNFKIKEIHQVIDYLAMMGDSADNIPGIPGVGKKTAQKFIEKYQSIEGLYMNLDDLKGAIKIKVEESKELAFMCKKLVTIITTAPIDFNEQEASLKKQNTEKLLSLYKELEFNNLHNKLLKNNLSNIGQNKNTKKDKHSVGDQIDLFSSEKQELKNSSIYKTDYKIIENEVDLDSYIGNFVQEKIYAISILTERISRKNIGLSIVNKSYNLFVSFDYLKNLEKLFINPECIVIGFDLKNLFKTLSNENIILNSKIFDVRIAYYLLNPDSRNSLDIIFENYLPDEYSIFSEKNSIDTKNEAETRDFFMQESNDIFRLHEFLKEDLNKNNLSKLFNDIEMPLVYVLGQMEIEGITLDSKMLGVYERELSVEIEKISNEIFKLSKEKFNIASAKQMGEVLFDKMALVKKPKKTKSGQFSTSEETLIKLKNIHPIIQLILDYRGINKLLSTYVKALPLLVNKKTNRIHSTFNQSVASTGRLSSTNPNLQNIPIKTSRGMVVRKAFVPRSNEHVLIAADYSQIELRIMAALSQDEAMIDAFNNNLDIHSATASKVYKTPINLVDKKMRTAAKSVNFGIIYGISAYGLSQNIGIPRHEAKEIIEQYFKEFPKVKEYMGVCVEKARSQGFVETIMGRKRYLRDINSSNAVVRSLSERNAINTPIQGSAADIIKKSMIDIYNEIKKHKFKSKMILQVHDELIFDAQKSEAEELCLLIKNSMENTIKINVPLIVDIGQGFNWLEAH